MEMIDINKYEVSQLWDNIINYGSRHQPNKLDIDKHLKDFISNSLYASKDFIFLPEDCYDYKFSDYIVNKSKLDKFIECPNRFLNFYNHFIKIFLFNNVIPILYYHVNGLIGFIMLKTTYNYCFKEVYDMSKNENITKFTSIKFDNKTKMEFIKNLDPGTFFNFSKDNNHVYMIISHKDINGKDTGETMIFDIIDKSKSWIDKELKVEILNANISLNKIYE